MLFDPQQQSGIVMLWNSNDYRAARLQPPPGAHQAAPRPVVPSSVVACRCRAATCSGVRPSVGTVSVDTVTAQLLYEVGGHTPWLIAAYLTLLATLSLIASRFARDPVARPETDLVADDAAILAA